MSDHQNVIPFSSAKASTKADSDLKEALFKWANELLDQIGIKVQVEAAQSVNDLQYIRLDLNCVDVIIAIKTAMSPASVKINKHFEGMSIKNLETILRTQFDDLKKNCRIALGNKDASEPYKYNGPELPNLLRAVLDDFADVSEIDATAITLWTLTSHVYDYFAVSPRLNLKSPEPGCGKSQLLDLLAMLTRKGERSDDTSGAALFRAIDSEQPTMLLDEIDCKDISELENILRTGYRKNGFVSRTIDGERRKFSIFGPIAMATVTTRLSDALQDRSIFIDMQMTDRKDLLDPLEAVDHVEQVVKPLYFQICAWAATKPLVNTMPVVPDQLHNRRAKNWRVLIAVADCFGEEWGSKARAAASASLTSDKKQSLQHLMLLSSKLVWDKWRKRKPPIDRCSAKAFLKALHALPDLPWREMRIKERDVTKLLEPYRIKPGTVWPKARRTANSRGYRGYQRSWFTDAHRRYLQEEK